MTTNLIFDTLCNGSGGRLAFGSTVMVYLVIYNETSGPTAVFATMIAMIYGLLSATCKTRLRSVQMPYIRASNKFDFTFLFLATWMDLFALSAACGALARTLSTCLDAMTGGLARILILGRNSPANEPWPDVLGIGVVFLVTGMFMLGLENTKAFGFIMTVSMIGLNGVLSIVGWYNGNSKAWDNKYFLPNGFSSLLTASALTTFAFPSEYPNQRWGCQYLVGFFLTLLVSISLLLASGCLSSIVYYKSIEEYIAVPLFAILEENDFHKLVPAAACLLMLTCSGSFLELFTEFYTIIVRFATSEWKILSKQISYESSDSGNPVLAVFIAGSLASMLAFVCPLQNLTYMLGAGHLCSGLLRAFYLLYIPYRPKYIQQNCDSSLSYSRLTTVPVAKSTHSARRRSLWNINLPMQNTLKKPRITKSKSKREAEKEWLLLGEPSSPCPSRDNRDVESTILSDGEPTQVSDFEYTEKCDNSDSDISTDIDAIVDEYRQKVKVTTAGPMERTTRVPSIASWRVTIFAIVVIAFGISLTLSGIIMEWPPASIIGCVGIIIVSIMMAFIPKYTGSVVNVSPVLCSLCLTLGFVLLFACLEYSWIAIIVWAIGGLLLMWRCDNWFCYCFDQPTLNDDLIPSVSAKTTRIRMPRPPKGIVIPTRIPGHR